VCRRAGHVHQAIIRDKCNVATKDLIEAAVVVRVVGNAARVRDK
jgi:hypothetical protein